MREIFVGLLVTPLFFGSYQLLARSAGKTDATGAFIIALTALFPLGVAMAYKGVNLPPTLISTRLALAGLVMGTGFIFNIWVITHPDVEVSIAVTIIAALVVAVVTIGGVVFFHETLSTRKIAGIILAVIAILLLRPGR